jgi:hypothetical protein
MLSAYLFLTMAVVEPSAQAQVRQVNNGPLERLYGVLNESVQELDISPIQMLRVRGVILTGLEQLDQDQLNSKVPWELVSLRLRATEIECRKQIDSVLSPRQRQLLEEIMLRRLPRHPDAGVGATEAKIVK